MKLCAGLLILAAAGTLVAQVSPDPKLRLNRDTYHPAMELVRESAGPPATDAQLEQLRKLPLEAIWAAVVRQGYVNCQYSGLQTTRPTERLVGRALTMRYLPKRPDLEAALTKLADDGDWPKRYNVRAAEEAKPGDVLVVDLGGGIADGIFFGDVSALGAKVAGAKGAILYGSTRDLIELRDMEGFPVYAVGFDPRPSSQLGTDWNVPLRIGNITVLPGDVVVGDAEAIIFFPPSIAAKVIADATETMQREEYERGLARSRKHRFRDVYPMSPELRKKYEEERGSK